MGYSVVTTVLFPADSHDLTDLATVKSELSIGANDTTKDTWLAMVITQVSKSIERYCKRVFAVEQLQDRFDIEQDPYPYQTPGGFPQLALTRWPVTELASVEQMLAPGVPGFVGGDGGGTCIPWGPGSTPGAGWSQGRPPNVWRLHPERDFRLDKQTGRLLRLNRFTGVGTLWEAIPVTVTYTAGYWETPDDLVVACLRLVTARFSARGRDPSLIQMETPGVGTQRFWFGGAPGQTGPFPPDITAILDEYRVPTVA